MPQDSNHPEYTKRISQWQRCRDAYEGSDAIKNAREKYLPRLTKQEDESYKAYLDRALFYGATERTVGGLTGAAISKPYNFKIPSSLKYLEEDATPTQMCLDELVKWLIRELLLEGRLGILVDRDKGGVEPPYCVPYTTEQIINWDVDEDGELTRVVLLECIHKPSEDDPYLKVESKQWRELVLENGAYVQKIHTRTQGSTDFTTEVITPNLKGAPLDYIPFAIGTPEGLGFDCVKPPLLSLIDVNISHYRNSADLEHGRHYTGLPTPWVAGARAEKELMIGSSTAWMFDDPTTKVGFLEFTGEGLKTLERAQEQKEVQMAVLGARLLEGQKAGVEAADTVRMRQSGDTFTLGNIAASVADILELCLSFVDRWNGGDGASIEVEPNLEFVDTSLSAQEITALVGALNANAISHETFLWNLKKGERMTGDVQDELDLIEKAKANAPAALPQLTPEERAKMGLPPAIPQPPISGKVAPAPAIPPKPAAAK